MTSTKLSVAENDSHLCADANENMIVTSTENGSLICITAKNKYEVINRTVVIPDHEVPIVCLKKSFPFHIYSASGNNIYLHDTRKFDDAVLKLTFNKDDINHICLNNGEEYLCSADDSGCIKIISVNDGNLHGSINAHESTCFTLKIRSHSSDEILSGGHDCKMYHWNFLIQKKLQSFNLVNLNNDPMPCINPPYVLSVDFSSNGNLIAAGLQNGSLHLWKMKCNRFKKLNTLFDAHSTLGLTQVHFLKNSPLLVTGGNDGFIKVWNSKKNSELPISTFSHGNKVNWITTIPDTHSGIICDTSSYLTIYELLTS